MSDQWVEMDPENSKPTVGSHEPNSETTSLESAIYRGEIENDRRYQTLRQGDYWGPSDQKQFESQEIGHILCELLDSDTVNSLFQAPVDDPKQILDIGTGKGTWAVDVADRYPNATIRGVDLFPPPTEWVPQNCLLEVDDLLLDWTWREPFDLIHLRFMIAAWTPEQWDVVYKRCYDHTTPGGWIEQVEVNPRIMCDDDSLPLNASIRNLIRATTAASKKWNRHLDTSDTMRDSIDKAGFIDIQEKSYRWPIGPWIDDTPLKEAGHLHRYQWLSGMEGWVMRFLTQWGVPEPWSKEEVDVLLGKVREELKNSRYHMYQNARRVWARKPTDADKALRETEIITSKDIHPQQPSSQSWWWS